ncbi:hypothetical protein EJ07DRAFT_160100 [Lizonia empirigonia]|nr:hypothetical protein EJ07DRAFT_160100 [Lizonia empirigonia]
MPSFFSLFRRRRVNPPQTLCFLDLPAEIRIKIYKFIAPGAFLLAVPHADYIGLLYSCKQIRDKMTYELLHAPPAIVNHTQTLGIFELHHHIRPTSLDSLVNFVVTMPYDAVRSPTSHSELFSSLAPVLRLHLSSLTFTLAGGDEANAPTYDEVTPSAMRINCLLAPRLCAKGHNGNAQHCIRRPGAPQPVLPDLACNTRMIMIRFKGLRMHLSDRRVTDLLSGHYGEEPYCEQRGLKRNGWACQGVSIGGDLLSPDKVKFVWKKMEKRKSGGFRKVDGRLLKGIGQGMEV